MEKLLFLAAASMTLFGLSACDPTTGGNASSKTVSGSNAPVLGESCRSSDPDHICLSLKYVVYKDDGTNPVVSQQTVANDIGTINDLWKQCNLGFQIENYMEVVPGDYGLHTGAAATNELDAIRAAFGEANSLLVVTTGAWGTVKNAWTQMPGAGTYGAILESTVGDYPNIIAHELGHYLGLDHVDDASDVMDALIYPSSVNLDSSQCATARNVAQTYWQNMLR